MDLNELRKGFRAEPGLESTAAHLGVCVWQGREDREQGVEGSSEELEQEPDVISGGHYGDRLAWGEAGLGKLP